MKGKKERSARNERIAALRARGLTLEAIAQQFGLTRERVRQITNGYQITRQFTTIPDLMARFGATYYEVMRAVDDAGLDKEALRQGRYFTLSDADVKRIVPHLKLHGARQCIICGTSFEVRGKSRKRLCSPECFLEHRRRMRTIAPGQARPMSERTQQMQALLSAESPGSTWVRFEEAVRLSGLKRMQLTWLRWRGIIACTPSGSSRFGRPLMLYSARHCELLRQFLSRQRHVAD